MDKKAKAAALEKMAGEPAKEIPAHKVKCPKCGYKWTMGEDEEKEDEEKEDEES